MGLDSTILVKIDKRTKKRMDSIDVNWSSRIRDFIERELMKKARMDEAERIRSALFREAPGLGSAEVIRKMRRSRHGASSN